LAACPRQLILAADAVEAARGFGSPLFGDIRLSRNVRAPRFNGRAFEESVGPSRYRWMADLGSQVVEDGGEAIRIRTSAAAEALWDLAEEAARSRRRVLFFCACETPGVDGEDGCCHRTRVVGLVLYAARRRKLAARVSEWSGGELAPGGFEVEVPEPAFEKVRRGAVWVPLGELGSLAEVAGLPWGTVTFVHCQAKGPTAHVRLLAGPTRYANAGWQLPVVEVVDEEASGEEISEQDAGSGRSADTHRATSAWKAAPRTKQHRRGPERSPRTSDGGRPR
jgi:hypothetical protein